MNICSICYMLSKDKVYASIIGHGTIGAQGAHAPSSFVWGGGGGGTAHIFSRAFEKFLCILNFEQ